MAGEAARAKLGALLDAGGRSLDDDIALLHDNGVADGAADGAADEATQSSRPGGSGIYRQQRVPWPEGGAGAADGRRYDGVSTGPPLSPSATPAWIAPIMQTLCDPWSRGQERPERLRPASRNGSLRSVR